MSTYLTLDEVVSNAQTSLGITGYDYMRDVFKNWAYWAQRSIGVTYLNKKSTEWVDIVDYAWEKPCGLVAPIKITIKKADGTCVEPNYQKEMDKCGCCTNTNNGNAIFVSENATEYYLSDNSGEYTKAKVMYYGIPTMDGQPLIPEKFMRAIEAYIIYKYTARERRRRPREITLSDVRDTKQDWLMLLRDAKGKSKMPHKLLFKEALRKWNTLVHSGAEADMRRRTDGYGDSAVFDLS